MSTPRRWYATLGAACALVAAATAAGIVLVFSGESVAAPTRAEYFARVAAICRLYGPKLDRVPPPSDIAVPGEVISSVGEALPLLEAEWRAVRGLGAPTDLRGRLSRWFELNDRVTASLHKALIAARRRDVGAMSLAFAQSRAASLDARKLGKVIGFPRPPC